MRGERCFIEQDEIEMRRISALGLQCAPLFTLSDPYFETSFNLTSQSDFGRKNAAWLISGGQQQIPQWHIASDSTFEKNIYSASNAVNLFPNTKPKPALRLRPLSTKKELAFTILGLLEDHPDLGSAPEIIREAIYCDYKEKSHWLERQESGDSDPSIGQLLTVMPNASAPPELLVCFVGGEAGNELYISALSPPVHSVPGEFGGRTKKVETTNLTFKPGILPAHAFSTPILQIAGAPTASQNFSVGAIDGPWIAVRTSAATTICSVVSPPNSAGREYQLHSVFQIARNGIGGVFEHSDFSFNPRRRSEALIVNRCGEIFLWRADTTVSNWKEEAQTCVMIFPALSTSTPKAKSRRDCFWRLAYGDGEDVAFLISSTDLYRLDLFSNERTKVFTSGYDLPHRIRHNFTSIVAFNSSETFFPCLYISTTTSIFAFDQRNPTRPAVALALHLNSDFTLNLSKCFPRSSFNSSSLILSSQKERFLLNVEFKTSHDVEATISLAGHPSLLKSSLPSGTLPCSPPSVVDLHSADGFGDLQSSPMLVLELGERGALWARFFDFQKSRSHQGSPDPKIHIKRVALLDEVGRLADRVENLGRLGETSLRVENLAGPYRAATNGTLFKQPPIEPDALASLAFQTMRNAAVEGRIPEPDIGVSSNVVSTTIDMATPETSASLHYFNRIELPAYLFRSSPDFRREMLSAVKSFKERRAPSIDYLTHVKDHFCPALSLAEVSSENMLDDESEDNLEDGLEDTLQSRGWFRGIVKNIEGSSDELAKTYLLSDSDKARLDLRSGRLYERIENVIRMSSDKLILDLCEAAQVWMPKPIPNLNPLADQAAISASQVNEQAHPRRPRTSSGLSDSPSLPLPVLQPNMKTISQALKVSRMIQKKSLTREDWDSLSLSGNSRSGSRFTSRSPSINRGSSVQSESEGSDESESENALTSEKLGSRQDEPSTLVGASALLARWGHDSDSDSDLEGDIYQERVNRMQSGIRKSQSLTDRDRSRSRSQSSLPRSSSARSSRTPGFSASQPLPQHPSNSSDGRRMVTLRKGLETPRINRFRTGITGVGPSGALPSTPQSQQAQPQSKSQLESQSQSQRHSQAEMASQLVPGRSASRPPESSKKKKKSAKKRKSGF